MVKLLSFDLFLISARKEEFKISRKIHVIIAETRSIAGRIYFEIYNLMEWFLFVSIELLIETDSVNWQIKSKQKIHRDACISIYRRVKLSRLLLTFLFCCKNYYYILSVVFFALFFCILLLHFDIFRVNFGYFVHFFL